MIKSTTWFIYSIFSTPERKVPVLRLDNTFYILHQKIHEYMFEILKEAMINVAYYISDIVSVD
jgi:hypothetical protein